MKEIEVPIEEIEINPSLYPRKDKNDEIISRYRHSIENLPPIQLARLDGNYYLVDGYHRLAGMQLERQDTVKAYVRDDIKNKEEILLEAIKYNSTHGLQLSFKEKARLAKKLYQRNFSISYLASLLSVSERTIRDWTKNERELEEFRRDLQMISLYLDGKTEAECASEVKGFADASSVSRRLGYYLKDGGLANFQKILSEEPRNEHEKGKKEAVEEILGEHLLNPFDRPSSYQDYSVWYFEKCDPRYGASYPGQMAGQIMENLLYSYTPIFGKVYDPFAGGGTTIDVCRAMFRRCWASDIVPFAKNKGVFYHDITSGLPKFPKGYKMDFVILDPPYWSQKRDEYSTHENNLANLSLDKFYKAMEDIAVGALEVLKDKGYLALIISPTLKKGTEYDHALELHNRISKYYKLVRRYIIPYTIWQYQAYEVTRARERDVRLPLHRDLLVFRKE